ncbi:hypothetical protein [Dyella mobilis]|uniref:Uncharacterized protein n=1 Tax=Dyella mobilis TaxID=1849582 RepID=A0ABS2KE16_9GAMM|nr:hypothetical protein [Dyella mobilis]MBM7129012.1 hypothetical protein [Dyella mobilis]GLQ99293.1 hypothetical protein GCM10007863_37130 [Dyella mobilis]
MSNHRQSGIGNPHAGSAFSKGLTSERIAADIAAFNLAGGCIEVLGNNPFHRKDEKAETHAHADHVSTKSK